MHKLQIRILPLSFMLQYMICEHAFENILQFDYHN